MAAKPRVALDPVADLAGRLVRRGRPALRTIVIRWWSDHGLAVHPAAVGKRIALALVERPHADAKLAGIVVLHELLVDQLRASDLASFETLFATGALADDAAVDRFAIDVLGTLLERVRGRAEVARALAGWRLAGTTWQRRAACVAFTTIAAQGDAALPQLAKLIVSLCAAVVWSPERGEQAAVGRLLRELSRADPACVEGFFRRYARLMSRACARRAVERLPAARQKELLAHWARATSLGGP